MNINQSINKVSNSMKWTLCFLLIFLSIRSFGQCPSNPLTGVDIHAISCGSFVWIDGNTYTAPNYTATDTLTNALGCDSIVTLNLILVDSNGLVQKGGDIDGESAGDQSGIAVSMPDAYTVAIGARGNNDNGNYAGHVRIYSWDGIAWVQKGEDIDGEAFNDESGYSVSMPDPYTVAIGAPSFANTASAGYVRIYSWNGTAWIQKGGNIEGETLGDYSGISVSMPDSNTVAIGAPNNDDSGNLTGHVRIYSWNGTVWVQKGEDIDGEAIGDYSGCSVSMPNSNTVAIGAYRNDDNGVNSGHVRIYSWNETAWIQKGEDINGEALGDYSGKSVSMPNANIVAIGAPNNSSNGVNSGRVRIYSWDGTTWIQQGGDINGDAFNYQLGYSVSMPEANTIALGIPGSVDNGPNSGQVRIYSWDGSAWIQKWGNINGEVANDASGFSVSMPDSQTVAIGALWNGDNGVISGHVRIYNAYDSIISNATFENDVYELCDSLTWIDGNTYTASNNTATYTLINSVGCDSIVTLDLTINSSTGTDVHLVCDSLVWIDGNTYTEPNNIATYTLINSVGCDSIVTLDLTIGEPNTGIDVHTISCGLFTWIDGNSYTAPNNTATYTLTSISGCDSIVTLDLTINSNSGTDVHVVCDSLVWIDGNTYTESNNMAMYTLTNVTGCDSIVTLDLTINVNSVTDVHITCDSLIWIDGNTYTESNNMATYTLMNVTGCDSIVTLDLTINESTIGTDVHVVCDSLVWIDGNTYTASNNIATHTLLNAAGCDSIVTLDLIINHSTTVTDVHVVCDSLVWIDGNTYTESNNTATHTLTNVTGCDSIVMLDLTINSNSETDVHVLCDVFTWIDGNIYTVSNNTATYTLTNVFGCDSIVMLDLTINSNSGTDLQEACDVFTWIDGNTYTASNTTATHTLTNVVGCDSIVTLDLTINSNSGTDLQEACDVFTWIDGNTYTASNNTATHTLTNVVGCDSVVTLDLTMNQFNTGTDVQLACDAFTWIDGNTYTTSNNTATHTLINASGCDSIVTLNLTMITINTSTTISGQTITSNEVGAVYQWIDCNNGNSNITGETNQSFSPNVNGNYAVDVSVGGCTERSTCVNVSTIGFNEYTLNNRVSVFPNPNTGLVNIKLGELKNVDVKVFNAIGQLIYNKENVNTPLYQFKLSAEVGIYFVEIYTVNKFQRIKLIMK